MQQQYKKDNFGLKLQDGASSVMKGYAAQGTGSWASGGNINTARNTISGLGIQTASLGVGGAGATGVVALNEEYNGSSWTELADLNTARSGLRGSGSTTAGIVFGGASPAKNETETWNGSSWTEVANLNTARFEGGSALAGTQTATLYFCGAEPSKSDKNESWEWN